MALLISRTQRPQFKFRPQTFEQGASKTFPAPYGGLNLRDDISALEPNEARVLENWLPTTGQLSIRPGFDEHATGLGTGEVPTLAAFVGYSASNLIAAANGNIYDATSAGAGSSLASGFSQNRWQTALYSNRLFFVNGTDAPQVYDGSTVAGIVWTGSGLTNTNLVNIALVRNRLWFCENNSADVWYANVGQITAASALTKFQLSQIAGGGVCMAINSWSRTDAGDGADDFTVFAMSTGEMIIYQGDPSTTFALVGKYQTAPPIGRQCLFKVGGELIAITRLGFMPLSAAVAAGQTLDFAAIDPWGKIAPGIVSDAAMHASVGGWHGSLHDGIVYLNVPKTAGAISLQRVLNPRTGSWTDYTGWNASALCSFGADLYFGSQTGGTVMKQTGITDNGSSIVASAAGAFIYPTKAKNTNIYTAVRPKLQADGVVSGLIGIDTDFVVRSLSGTSVNLINAGSSESAWGSPWDTTPWAISSAVDDKWFTVTGEGKAASVRLRVLSSSSQLHWYYSDVLYKPGGIR